MLYAIIGALALLADQLLKYLVVARVELNTFDGPAIIPGFLEITNIRNYGAFMGLLKNGRWIMLILLIVFLAVMTVLLLKGVLRTNMRRCTAALLVAGALGNGIDRLIYGYVVDMFEFLPGKANLPIFNIADGLILICGILFCVSLLVGGKRRERDEEPEWNQPAPRRKPRRADPFTEPEEGMEDPFAAGRVPKRRPRPEPEAAPVRNRRPAEPKPRTRRESEASLEDLRPRRPAAPARPAGERPARSGADRPAARPVNQHTSRPAGERPAPRPVSGQRGIESPDIAGLEELRPRRTADSAAPKAARPVRRASAARPEGTPAQHRTPAARPEGKPAQHRAPAARPEETPAQHKAPAARPAEKPAPAKDEFDLDSIMAEFK